MDCLNALAHHLKMGTGSGCLLLLVSWISFGAPQVSIHSFFKKLFLIFILRYLPILNTTSLRRTHKELIFLKMRKLRPVEALEFKQKKISWH